MQYPHLVPGYKSRVHQVVRRVSRQHRYLKYFFETEVVFHWETLAWSQLDHRSQLFLNLIQWKDNYLGIYLQNLHSRSMLFFQPTHCCTQKPNANYNSIYWIGIGVRENYVYLICTSYSTFIVFWSIFCFPICMNVNDFDIFQSCRFPMLCHGFYKWHWCCSCALNEHSVVWNKNFNCMRTMP